MQISYTWRKGGTCILRIQEIPGMLILRDQKDEKWTQKRASPRFSSLLYLFTSFVGLFNRKSILWNEDKGMNERTLCLPCVTHLTIREGPEKITIEDWTTKISGIRDFFQALPCPVACIKTIDTLPNMYSMLCLLPACRASSSIYLSFKIWEHFCRKMNRSFRCN